MQNYVNAYVVYKHCRPKFFKASETALRALIFQKQRPSVYGTKQEVRKTAFSLYNDTLNMAEYDCSEQLQGVR